MQEQGRLDVAKNLTWRILRTGIREVTVTLLDEGVRYHETITMSVDDAKNIAAKLLEVSSGE
jgi:hypothetical protein